MIYFVEEDTAQNNAFFLELECRGHQVSIIANADKAFQELSGIRDSDADLVILDVMLAVESEGHTRFERKATSNYIETGLVLLDDLIMCNPAVFPQKAVFFTNASSIGLVKKIESKAKQHGISLFRKADFDNPFDFADKIEGIIRSQKSK
jgi:hypothetical protein